MAKNKIRFAFHANATIFPILFLISTASLLGCKDDGDGMTGKCETPPGACVSVNSGNSVQGKYVAADGQTVSFSASSENGTAKATYTTEDGTMSVDLSSANEASITLGDLTMDGNGELDYMGAELIQDLSSGPLAEAIAMIPLELGCDENVAEDALIAAAVFPWQLRIKYADSDRAISVPALSKSASCVYFDDPTVPASANGPMPNGSLRLAAETPVPNAWGFFPLDNAGAVLATQAFTDAAKLYGACGSRCRGACGPDCTRANCTETIDWRCMNDDGVYTGEKRKWQTLDCGVHAGCVMHDQCYDDCQRAQGCGSWGASWCMHNGWTGCDVQAALAFGAENCWSWKSGGGPFELREDFEYPMDDVQVDILGCPPGAVDTDSSTDEDTDTGIDTDSSTCDGQTGSVNLDGTFPADAFNGMQIDYSVSGPAAATSTEVYDFTTSQTFAGCLGSGTFTVSGTAYMGNGFGASLNVSVSAGGNSDSYEAYLTTNYPSVTSEPFNISVPIPQDASSGSFSIDMVGDYNVGTRGLIVSGTFER